MGKENLSDTHASGLSSFPTGGIAVVIGASGAIGQALLTRLSEERTFCEALGYARASTIPLDLMSEASIELAAADVANRGAPLRLVIDATGVLDGEGCFAEKTWRQLNLPAMARAFAVNALGPALLMKHFLPLFPGEGKCLFATLSARVGSIGDNHLGGWYSYRASKAALNQFVRTAALELARTRPQGLCVALHPGTVATRLSARYTTAGLDVQSPAKAAMRVLTALDTLRPQESGGFYDQHGRVIPW